MGFFKKDRKGGKMTSGWKKGGGVKGMNKAMGGYTIYSSEKESGAESQKNLPGRLK